MSTATATHPLAKYVKAAALLLQAEFGVPFVFLDSQDGSVVAGPHDLLNIRELDLAASLEPARNGQIDVRMLGRGCYQLTLPLYRGSKVVLVAVGIAASMMPEVGVGDTSRERQVLQHWLQAVCDRLQLREQLDHRRHAEEGLSAQVTLAWETLLTVDGVLRRLRIHKEPERNVQLVLEAAWPLAQAESLCWIPGQLGLPLGTAGAAVLALGEAERFMTAVMAQPELASGQPFICNNVQQTDWGMAFPIIRTALVLQATEQEPLGWVVALNKKQAPGFRKTDAAVLSPFLALLEMYGKSLGRIQDMKELMVGMTRSLTAAIDAKDSHTLGHSERVARIAVEVARSLGLPARELGDVYLAALLHDIGKIGVQDQVLRKPGNLTQEEHEHIKQHVTIGFSILSELRAIRKLLPGVLYHHENYDGTGYPDGLKGESIPLLARILAVADAYDSMSSPRPYREALTFSEVEARLREGAGVQWDPQIVEALLRVRHVVHAIRQRGVGESLRVAMDDALRSRCSLTPSEVFDARAESGPDPCTLLLS